ncbi:MAG: acyltransferase [Bacteroidales bacterium]|nr:acyltransferase [Clostridium sp.]MCM1202909.1 acyltransferase [Bacteroidales bacterium]
MKFDKNVSNMVKGIAILIMLVHHLFGCLPEMYVKYNVITAPFSRQTLYQIGIQAKLCVSMFVFLSAFGMTRQYDRRLEAAKDGCLTGKEAGSFAVNRYIKLLFNFWFIYLLAALTSFLREGGYFSVYFREGKKLGVLYILFDAFGLADFFGTPTLNETWWYMALAAFLIFAVPILIRLYKENGVLIVAVAALFTYIGVGDTGFTIYLFCVCMGIHCAQEQVFERLGKKQLCKNPVMNTGLKCLLYLLGIAVLLYLRGITTYSYWIDAFFTMAAGGLCLELKSAWEKADLLLGFLGKHSMNIFLVHTLIFEYYFPDFIYGFRYWLLITLALLAVSLLISVCCEAVKKRIGYPALYAKCIQSLSGKEEKENSMPV